MHLSYALLIFLSYVKSEESTLRHDVDEWCDSGCGRRENESAFPTFTKQVIIKSHIINDVEIQLYHSA